MSDRADDLARFRAAAGALLETLQPAQRTRLLRAMAQDLRRTQQARIRAQVGPDGGAWPPRKPRDRKDKVGQRPVRFLYKGLKGEERVVEMRSWVRRSGPGGGYMVGYDKEGEGIRSFRNDRVVRHLPAEGGTSNPGALQGSIRGRRGGVKRRARAMFGKLRTAAHLKAGAGPASAWVGFIGRAEKVAAIHHYGLKDKVAPNGPEYDYPQRELLDFSIEDEEALLQRLLDEIGHAIGV